MEQPKAVEMRVMFSPGWKHMLRLWELESLLGSYVNDAPACHKRVQRRSLTAAPLHLLLLQVGLSVQEEDPRSLPLAARFSPTPGTLLQHSLHHVLAQESPAVSTTPDAVSGLAGVSAALSSILAAG